MTELTKELFDIRQMDRMASAEEVLDCIEAGFRQLGATHFLASGVPLPGRPIQPLLLRVDWGGLAESLAAIDGHDPLLTCPLCLHRAVGGNAAALLEAPPEHSTLVSVIGAGTDIGFVVVPIKQLAPYQAVVAAAGKGFHPNPQEVGQLDVLCETGMRRLIELKAIEPFRPGGLSSRERRVVELSAHGKTAHEIAEILKISQRTVHAHLQNASNKLMAGNKTQTVVEALRYAQIFI